MPVFAAGFFIKRKDPERVRPRIIYGGKTGIRTMGALLTHTRFPVVRLRPAQPSFLMQNCMLKSVCGILRLSHPPCVIIPQRNALVNLEEDILAGNFQREKSVSSFSAGMRTRPGFIFRRSKTNLRQYPSARTIPFMSQRNASELFTGTEF